MLESDYLPGHHARGYQVRRQRRRLSHVDRIKIGVTEAAAASASHAKASAGRKLIDLLFARPCRDVRFTP